MFRTITPAEAKESLDRDPNIILLDVRSREEFDQGHIHGAVVIPYEDNKDFIPQLIQAVPDRSATLYVYCRSGKRSRLATETLSDLGYLNVFHMGGIQDWPYGTE